jgi:hypothetical protein
MSVARIAYMDPNLRKPATDLCYAIYLVSTMAMRLISEPQHLQTHALHVPCPSLLEQSLAELY